jgi:hypothetical protein
MVHLLVVDGRDGLQIWRVATYILNKHLERANKGGPPAWDWMKGYDLIVKTNWKLVHFTKYYQVIKLRMGWTACMGEIRNARSILVGRPEGKRPVAKAGHRWEDNIRMDLGEKGWQCVDWICLAQDRDQ